MKWDGSKLEAPEHDEQLWVYFFREKHPWAHEVAGFGIANTCFHALPKEFSISQVYGRTRGHANEETFEEAYKWIEALEQENTSELKTRLDELWESYHGSRASTTKVESPSSPSQEDRDAEPAEEPEDSIMSSTELEAAALTSFALLLALEDWDTLLRLRSKLGTLDLDLIRFNSRLWLSDSAVTLKYAEELMEQSTLLLESTREGQSNEQAVEDSEGQDEEEEG